MAKDKDLEMRLEDASDGTESDPRVYELGFHLDPELPTEQMKKAYQAIRELVASKGVIVEECEPEKIQLAYTIFRQETAGRRDFNSAYFCWIAYEVSSQGHAEIISAAGANAHIIRFIDLLTTKDAARHAVEIREISLKAPTENTDSPEETLAVELDTALEKVVV